MTAYVGAQMTRMIEKCGKKSVKNSVKKGLKTGLCFLFAILFFLSGPVQIVAIAKEDAIYTGVNEYELQASQPLTEDELDSMLEELQAPYTENLEEPVVFQETVNNPVAATEEATGMEESGTEEGIASEETFPVESFLVQSLEEVAGMLLGSGSSSIPVEPLNPMLQIYPMSTFTKGKNAGIQLLLSGNVPSETENGIFKSLAYTLYKGETEIETKK